ncbi:MAG: phosphoribosylanthranilate isomerase [Cytophagaceae bacterium]|nr:MAG: phosphoribosylanthranilate isomerase [Cytophagaceae bacterium]
MKIKICGMREAGNLLAIADLNPDFLGFIFYEKSVRCVRDVLAASVLHGLPSGICKVGIFVNADLAEVRATAARYHLDYVQLHGTETPAYCQQARALGLRLIKAFAVDADFDFSELDAYAPLCEYFLFDTKGELPGGNGTAFDWSVLTRYTGTTPFFLSGGLGLVNVDELRQFKHPQLCGLDFNSRLETAPGVKDVDATRQLLERLRAEPDGC